NKYQCRIGPFEGFFVSSVEFCKHVKFDDRKDNDRKDNNLTRTPGPQGPVGIEAYPIGTDQIGHFIKGDGNNATTAKLFPLCNLPDAEVEVYASTTDFAGMKVDINNKDLFPI
ncbi:MAG TPA: hypothetical protein VFC05_01790, partial [Nitrososphaeraceae archaeon]|nr:hypothetical protein [Nitrososphaeraceae archaeon]